MTHIWTRTYTALAAKLTAAVSALALGLSLSACGSSSDQSQQSQAFEGVSASGELGKEPKVTLKTPLTFEDNAHGVLQEGNGAPLEEGDRVCAQAIAYNAQSGAEMMNTWKKGKPNCDIVLTKQTTSNEYMRFLTGKKLNSTLAIGINDKSAPNGAYVMVLTLISKSKDLTRAQGKPVTNIPANLPTVKLDANGKPSIDFHGYQPGKDLVVQPLIEGSGAAAKENDTVSVQYTGWVQGADGKPRQFDSSWDRGEPASFGLKQVVQGWTRGLTGQKVGSQVLLIIPPDLAYGSQEQKDAKGNVTIPANSTLYFVVDLLHAGM